MVMISVSVTCENIFISISVSYLCLAKLKNFSRH